LQFIHHSPDSSAGVRIVIPYARRPRHPRRVN
jgi:hypothetical protein